jgi:NADH-quinone oxidoreductase subunit F
MATPYKPIFLANVGNPEARTLQHYEARGGYQAARTCLHEMQPEAIIELVKSSGLRGKGGAGFSAGTKWGFVPKQSDKPRYLVANADESEPGTFKDRAIFDWEPHMLIDGMICCSVAVGIHTAYVYIRGEFTQQAEIFQAALDEAYAAGHLGKGILGSDFDLDITLHRGAGAYICGEETGMLTSIEGGRGYPKLKPPFPAVEGLFGCPTVVNNVETLATVPHIVVNGADWHRQWGTEKSPGMKLFSISGHVNTPGNYELPYGTRLMDFINEQGGGVWKGRQLKCVIPGGTSCPPLTREMAEQVTMDFESMAEHGTMLGSGAVIVLDDRTCMVDTLWNIMRFYHHESCGQCTPCREGMGWYEKMLARLERGQGRMEDLDLMVELAGNMCGRTVCVLADAGVEPARAFVQRFRSEFEAHVTAGKCPFDQSCDGLHGAMEPAAKVVGVL